MSENGRSTSFSECLVLDDSDKGVIIKGITDDTLAVKSGLQAGDKIMAATIHLDHLTKNEVQNILKVLEPYDNNMKVLTKKELTGMADLGSMGLGLKDSAELLSPKENLSLDTSSGRPAVSIDGLNGKLHDLQRLDSKISGPTPSLSINHPKADFRTPQLTIPSASLDIRKPESKTGNLKYNPPKFEMPQFSLPRFKTPEAEMDVGDVDLPSVNGKLEASDLNLSSPKTNLKSPGLDLKVSDVDLSCPRVNLETPNANIETPSGKVTWPNQKWKGPKVKGPDANLSADLSASDVNISKPNIDMDLNTPDVDINLPKTDIKGSDVDVQTGKINWPHLKFKKPKAGLDIDGKLDTPDVDLSVPNVDSEINAPDVDINLPKADTKGSDVDVQTGKINWPHLKFKKPKAGLDIDGNLDTPDVDLSVPNVDSEINAPDVDINLPKADTKGSDVDVQTGKINWPHLKFKKPKAGLDIDGNLDTPDVDLSVPNVDSEINAPDVDMNLPKADIKGSDVDVQTGKINWPHLKFKKPKLQVSKPDLDMAADVNTPDLYLSSPKIKGDIDVPNAELSLPKVDLPSTSIDAQAPDLDVDTSGKINWPHLKWGKPKIHSPNSNMDADLCIPDVDVAATSIAGEINAPEDQVNLPKVKANINTPDTNSEAPSGKFKFLTFKKQKGSGPKVKVPDVDLDADVLAPDLKVSVSKIDGEINAPEAQVNLSKIKADINAPDANINAPSGKFRFPTLKKQKVSEPKMKVPDVDLDADVSAPDLKVSIPKIDGEINAPEAQVNLSKVKAGINAPDANIEPPSGKFKFPTLKKQKVSGSKVKVPDVDLDADVSTQNVKVSIPKIDGEINAPEAQVNLPKVKAGINAPDANIEPPSGKFKFPTLKKQKVSGSKVKVPDVDLGADVSAPDLKVSVPKIDGEINAPEALVNLPKVKAGINAPDANIEAPSGKFKFPIFKKQKVSGPKVKVSDVDLGADVSAPDLKFSVPKTDGEINAPEAQVNLPKVKADINAPDPNIETPSGKLKFPTFKKQKVSGPKMKVPDIDANLDSSKINLYGPKVDVKAPNLSLAAPQTEGLNGPNIDHHDSNVDASTEIVKLPNLKFLSGPRVKGPNLDAKAELKGPDLDLSDVDGKLPKTGITAQNVNTELPKGIDINVKTPKIDSIDPFVELPAAVVKGPNLSLSAPRIKGDQSPSNLDADLKTNVKGPSVNLPKISDLNFKAPDVSAKLPNSELKAPDATLTGPNMGINLPTDGLQGPDALIGTPDLDCNSHLGDFKLPHCKFPNLGLSSPEAEVPIVNSSVNVEAPRVNVGSHTGDATTSAPSVDLSELNSEGDIKRPEIELKALNVDTSLEKSKGLNFKFPKFGLSGSKTKAPEVNTGANLNVSPDVKVKAPSVEAGVSSPDVNMCPLELKTSLNWPELDVRDEGDTEKKGSLKSKLSWPIKSKSTSGNVKDEGGVHSEPNVSSADVDVPVFKFHRLPRNSINDIGEIGEALNLSKSDAEDKNYVVSKGIRLPILNKSAKAGEKIDIMERLKLAREKVQSPDVNLAGISSLMKEGHFKIENSSNENDKLSLGLSNMLGLNSQA